MEKKSSKRVDAIKKAYKEKEEGRYRDRTWYIDREKLEELGIKEYKSKVGDNFICIIPPKEDSAYFGIELFVHYNIGVNDSAFLCPREMEAKACPICEKWKIEKQSGNDDKDYLRTLSPYPPRHLFFIVDVASKETKEIGIQIFDAPTTINDGILEHSVSKRTGEVVDVSDPDEGKNFVFSRKGKGRTDTKYSGFDLEDRDPVPDEWLKVPSFDEFLIYAEYKTIKEEFEGVKSEEPKDEMPEGSREMTEENKKETEVETIKERLGRRISGGEPKEEEKPKEEPEEEEKPRRKRRR